MPDSFADLTRVELFSEFDDAGLRQLAARSFVRRLAKGQVLFTEGEPSDHLYIVRSGLLRVFVSSPDGEDLTLTVAGPGESLGEVTVLSGEARTASVDALQAAEVLAVPASGLRALLLTNPEALLALTARLAATVRRVTGTAADLVFLDVPRRLAKLLVADAVQLGDGTLVCDFNMSQTGVAARVGATRQSLNRALGDFTKRGWITADGTAVRLDNRDALMRFAAS